MQINIKFLQSSNNVTQWIRHKNTLKSDSEWNQFKYDLQPQAIYIKNPQPTYKLYPHNKANH